jgi:hypothetical protein
MVAYSFRLLRRRTLVIILFLKASWGQMCCLDRLLLIFIMVVLNNLHVGYEVGLVEQSPLCSATSLMICIILHSVCKFIGHIIVILISPYSSIVVFEGLAKPLGFDVIFQLLFL